MTVNIVTGKDPALCAARRCKEVTDEQLCTRHAAMDTPTTGSDLTVVQAQAAEDTEEARSDLAELEAFEIENQEDLDLAGEMLSQVQGEIKRLEGAKKDLLAPVKETKTRIEALFNPAIKLRKDAKELLKGKITAIAVMEAERNTAALEAGNHSAMTSTDDAGGFTTVVDEWELDPDQVYDMKQIPAEYLTLYVAGITKLCHAHKGGDMPEVPGLTFKRKVRVIARA